ncbi:MAG: hypothetical protein AB7S26_22885 [Sandaracinaceae bacterium]
MGVILYEEAFPLLVYPSPSEMSELAIQELDDAFKRVWARGERYALISVTAHSAPPASGRQRMAAWASRDDVYEASGRYCVGSATIVSSALHRGALTAILWLFRPAAPHETFGTVDEGIDYCLARIAEAALPTPIPPGHMRSMVKKWIDANAPQG